MYEIFIYFVNVVYLNKCAHTIKSLNLTDSVQNIWQKILIAPSPSSSQMFTLRDVWILDIILIFLMFEFQVFFYLMNWKEFVQLMRNLWQVEQVVACLNLALPDHSASIFFGDNLIWDSWFLCCSIYMFYVKLELICNKRTNPV